ncbi:MAG: hypothetical protein O7G88_16825 [bacterium]|nr:hypothetical protein [bacterium]
MRQGLLGLQTAGAKFSHGLFSTWLAEAYGKAGQSAGGLRVLNESETQAQKTGERVFETERHRLKGTLLLQQPNPDALQAEACFQQSLDIARRQQAKSLELRTATSLARLWQSQDKRQDARDLLAPVYNWFTEGFDTEALQEAKGLLEELA